MATVTGYTAEHLEELLDESFVEAEVVGDDLILTKRGGDTVNAGDVRGPIGPNGVGVPNGGATGRVLTKLSPADGDAGWSDPAALIGAGDITQDDVGAGNDGKRQLLIAGVDFPSDIMERAGATSNGDLLGQHDFYGQNAAAARKRYAKIQAVVNDITNGSEDGELRFSAMAAGAEAEIIRLLGGASPALWLMQNRLGNSDGTRTFTWGAAAPGGSVSASAGSIYLHTGGGSTIASPVLYIKRYGTGSAGWRAVDGLFTYSSNDQAVTSSTTLVDATGLSLSVYHDGTDFIEFEAMLQYYGNTTNDIKIAVTTSTALRLYVTAIGPGLSTVSGEGLIAQAASSSGVELAFGGYSSILPIWIKGGWIPNSSNTSDTIKIQFAQNTSHATPTRMSEGSWIKASYK